MVDLATSRRVWATAALDACTVIEGLLDIIQEMRDSNLFCPLCAATPCLKACRVERALAGRKA